MKRIAMVTPEVEPGHEQWYHYQSDGWLCGGIIEHASGKKFQDILEQAFARPLNVEGGLLLGIPPGVESRLATLTLDTSDLSRLTPKPETSRSRSVSSILPSSFSFNAVASFIPLINTLNVRRAIVPSSNEHFSARALARYYAALVDGGVVPPRHPSSSLPESDNTRDEVNTKIFTNTKALVHDSFLGSGDYKDLIILNGRFGLGFTRVNTIDDIVIGFGHSGFGGSTGYCDINNRFAITVNKLSFGSLTGEIIRFVCSELDLPVPEDYAGSTEKPVIN